MSMGRELGQKMLLIVGRTADPEELHEVQLELERELPAQPRHELSQRRHSQAAQDCGCHW